MKAAVLHHIGQAPRYEDFPDPVAQEDELLITVKAVPLENVDRAVAAGTHYASAQYSSRLPAIVGFDGAGTLQDGTLVGFGNPRLPYGAFAEKTVVPKQNVMPLPPGLDPAVAVSLGTAVTAFAMKLAGGLKPGETVLINGATGVAGRLAVKVARLMGAGRVVATGRDEAALADLSALGADAIINTAVPDGELEERFREGVAAGGYDVVLDFLWGLPTEILLKALTPRTFGFAKPTRLIQVGEAAGSTISIAAEALRTSGVEVYGAGRGFSAETAAQAYSQVVAWAQEGKLTIDIERVRLADIESVWTRPFKGRRFVVVP